MQVINAGISSKMAADNMTGCLPDVWQFCGLTSAGANTNLMCPSVSYRRPVQPMSNKLSQVDHAERLCEKPIMFICTTGTVQQEQCSKTINTLVIVITARTSCTLLGLFTSDS